jgi:hypothetical protein
MKLIADLLKRLAARRKRKTRVYSRALGAFLLVHLTSSPMLARAFSRDNPAKTVA